VQPPVAQPQLDRAATEAGGEQLRVGDHAFLTPGEPGEHPIHG
jgi:hypothetical protein